MTDNRDLFIEKEGMYDRMIKVWIERSICDKCNSDCDCMAFDTSDGEYGIGHLCCTCINVMSERSVAGIKLSLPRDEPSK